MPYQDQAAKERAAVDARASKNAAACLQVIRRHNAGGISVPLKMPAFPPQITSRQMH